jgi:hypothetical protein
MITPEELRASEGMPGSPSSPDLNAIRAAIRLALPETAEPS